MPQHCCLLRQTITVIVEPDHRLVPPENIFIKIFGSRYLLLLVFFWHFFSGLFDWIVLIMVWPKVSYATTKYECSKYIISMLPNQLFFEWICVGGKRKLIEISFYSSQTLSSDFRVQYCKMWQALIRSDIDGVKQSSEALGVGEMYGLLACILTARSWDVVTTGIDQGPVTDHEVCFRV